MKKALGFLIFSLLFAGVMTVSAQSSPEALQTRIAEVEAAIERIQLEIDRLIADGTLSEPVIPAFDRNQLKRMNDVVATSKGKTTLTDARITSKNQLILAVTIENDTEEKVSVYENQFNIRDKDGWMLDSEYTCETTWESAIEPGATLTGDLCFKLSGSAPFRLYFEAESFENEIYIWEITE